MKRLLCLALAVCVFVPPLQLSAQTAQTNEEQQLIGVLQSNQSPREKDAACARLKRIGTAQSVPALAVLLTDEQLSHSARYALESMPSAKGGQALVDALAKTSGLAKVGIINSLGFRHETRAVPALVALLTDHDAQVAAAAAVAMGQIGGSKALSALQTATANSAGPVHSALVDACLRCANSLLAAGNQSRALEVFQQLYDTEKKDGIRTAAYRGMIQASGKRAMSLMTTAILGAEGASQIAALQLVREVTAPGATEMLASMLRTVDPPVQVALVEGLSQRGDVAAVPAIAALATSASPEVRLAAINALGILGDATMVPLLGVSAASASGEEQKAARLALVELRRGNPTETLLRLLPAAKPEVQAEFARALGDRSDRAAVPKLVELAREASGSATKAALQALVLLVDDSQVGLMVQFVIEAKTDTTRADAAEALNSACHQILTRRGRVNIEPLMQALATAPTDARVALLPVCSGLIDPKVRSALRAAVAASDPQVRAAAIRALCDTCDPELLPDVVRIACGAPEENFRTLAVRACVRLTTQEETIKLPVKEQIEPLKTILATTLSADQKRLVLAGLAEIPDSAALALAEPMLDEAATQLEAAKAVTKIASALPYAQAEVAATGLKKVVATTSNADVRKAAETALNEVQSGADYIMAWQIAGPYLQEGKEYKDLFDMVFPPETADAQAVKWQAIPPGPDAKRPWMMDLLKALGGEQRVAYARTWVHSDQQQPARLELGTDDGVKVWLNGKVVHANNTFRALQPGSDKVDVTLNAGWNPLLLKVTQLNQGWGFCARFRKPDGSHLDGLQFAAERP
ncbi:MAG: HEAT repeat domain-containing protein [Limisphaerales bacterium]